MVHTAPTISGSGRLVPDADIPALDDAVGTAFNSPPRPVDFSALVAPRVRR